MRITMKGIAINIVLTVVFVLSFNFALVASSEGDRSPYYENCVLNCLKRNCTEDVTEFTKKAAKMQDMWARLIGYNCKEECRYHCMWRTVSAYEERHFEIPKFHGKWPFKRILGAQEPVSVFGSILNLAAHVYMYWQLVTDKRFSLENSPLMYFWHFFFAVCANAWVWSVLFHTHDTPLTEFMDYACALSFVVIHFVAAIVRLLYRKPKAATVIIIFTLVYYIQHVRYLASGNLDYEFNMTVNIITGMIATALWMLFSLGALCGAGGGGSKGQLARRYVWRLVVFCKLSGASVLLELFDFPPYMRLVDSHALWHLCTWPLPLLFYRFVIDDLDYLLSLRQIEKKTDDKLA